jgi:hypothetical protein
MDPVVLGSLITGGALILNTLINSYEARRTRKQLSSSITDAGAKTASGLAQVSTDVKGVSADVKEVHSLTNSMATAAIASALEASEKLRLETAKRAALEAHAQGVKDALAGQKKE